MATMSKQQFIHEWMLRRFASYELHSHSADEALNSMAWKHRELQVVGATQHAAGYEEVKAIAQEQIKVEILKAEFVYSISFRA